MELELPTRATKFDLTTHVHVSLKQPVMVSGHHSGPLKDPPLTISFSPLDRIAPIYMYMLLFFENNARKENETVFCELKKALQQVLVTYFPLAGRLRKDENRGYAGIECSNKGVLLVEATLEGDDELDLLRDFNFFISNFEDKFVYKLEPKPENPLLTVQITRFSSGKFVLGIGWMHEVHDGFGISFFLKALADVARGKPLSSIPQPYHGRDLLQPKPGHTDSAASEWQQKLHEQLQGIPIYNIQISHEEQALDRSVTDPATLPSLPLYITKIFPITKSMISCLKKQAMEGGYLTSCTTFEVVTTHAWRARVKAFEMQPNERALLAFAVNARPRTDPPLPEHYSGNAFVVALTNCSVEEVSSSSPFHATVQRIQETKSKVGESYIADVLRFIDDRGMKGLPSFRETTVVTDWSKFAFEKLDFGWGETSFVSPVAMPQWDVMCYVRTALAAEEEGGVSLRVALPPNVMATFERHLLHI